VDKILSLTPPIQNRERERMKLRITKGSEAGRVVEPDPTGFSIGRGKDNDLVLPGEGLSRHHCRIEETPDGWIIEDLGSVNGVRVDGLRVEDHTVLTDGCLVDICGQEMEVELAGAAASSPPPPPAPEPPVAAPPEPVTPPEPAAPPIVMQPGMAEEKSPLPWGRIALLVAMCALIGALAYLLTAGGGESTDESGGDQATATVEKAGDDATPNPNAPALNDQDLDRLLREEAAMAANKPTDDTDTPPSPATDAPATPEPAAPTPTPAPAPATSATGDAAAATDMVLVRSTPEGATIYVDDEEKGTTPALITGLADGRHRIMLKLDGYEDQQRLIHVPDLPAPSPYLLRQRPNTLRVTSDPPGVSVWRGSQWLGVAPVLLQGLPAGDVTLTLALAGCPPQRRKVTISSVRGEQLQVEMKPPLGDMEIDTLPAGCQVFVDGVDMGTTVAPDGGNGLTGRLAIPNLLAGERSVRIEHPCGASLSGKLPVTAAGTLKRTLQLWVPNTQVTLLDGSVSTGMLRERNAQGDIVLALTPRAKDMVRYLKPRIREERTLTEAEMQAAFRKVMAPEPEAKTTKEDKDDVAKEPADVVETWGDEADPEGEKTEPAGDKIVELSAQKLNSQLDRYPKSKVLQRYKGVTVQISGKATAVRRDGITGVVHFGRRILCEMDREAFSLEQDKLNALQDTDNPITMRGRIKGFIGDRLVLRDCQPVYGPDKPKEE
jgi:hypothetical protein